MCDDDGRRRPADRNGLELWAPAGAGTIPLGPSGLVETERHDVPHVPGRGLHSSAFRLNVSAFCGIRGA